MTDTAVQGFVVFKDGSWSHLFNALDASILVDGTEEEVGVRTVGGSQESLYKSNEGKLIERVAVQLADGSIVATLRLYDAKNGIVAAWIGNERNVAAKGAHKVYDINVKGLAIPVTKGMVLKINTTD